MVSVVDIVGWSFFVIFSSDFIKLQLLSWYIFHGYVVGFLTARYLPAVLGFALFSFCLTLTITVAAALVAF